MILGWAAAALYAAVLLRIAQAYASRRPRLGDYPPTASGPPLSVIIPARNEARNIERCVRSILAARYAPLEIVVVDDRSTDGTGDVVERIAAESQSRVHLIRGADLPERWFGKQWAIIQGYRAASGELLLFADADTAHDPDLVPRAVTMLGAERVDLATVLPQQEMVTFWERLIQPQVFLALMARVSDLTRIARTRVVWDAIANGQFILTTRAAYQAVGTHEAVKHTVADDVALAQAYVAHGKDIFLAHAADYMRTRMYRSLGEIVEGWSKNLALGAPLMMPPVAWLRRLVPYVIWVPSLAWLGPPVAWVITGWSFALAATLLSLAIWLLIYWQEKVPVWYAALYPLGSAMVAFIMLRSAWRGGRKVEWRGRVYRV